MTKTKPFKNIDLKGDWDTINQANLEEIWGLNISINEVKKMIGDSNSLKFEFYSLNLKVSGYLRPRT